MTAKLYKVIVLLKFSVGFKLLYLNVQDGGHNYACYVKVNCLYLFFEMLKFTHFMLGCNSWYWFHDSRFFNYLHDLKKYTCQWGMAF